MSGVLSIVVRLQIIPGRRDQFLDVMVGNAIASVRDEPGCSSFDVTVSRDDPDSVLLYETYDDDAAFEAHRTTSHYADWQAARSELVVEESQTIERFDVVYAGEDR